MSGNAKDQARFGQSFPQFNPLAAVNVIFNGVHRVAMTDKESWKAGY